MMVIKKLIKKYQAYEDKEVRTRAERMKKAKPYKRLARKMKGKKMLKKVKNSITSFDKARYTKAIGNPYGVAFPKANKVLKKTKKVKATRTKIIVRI